MNISSKRGSQINPLPTTRMQDKCASLIAEGKDVIDLSIGDTDFRAPDLFATESVYSSRLIQEAAQLAEKKALFWSATRFTQIMIIPDISSRQRFSMKMWSSSMAFPKPSE